ncbi:T9SS type A sorting domain-containing protein [Xanthomarina sp. F2636L]|uniref:T9SS type A sorting domain-containing protein n=1 Tax=Xanthomarina sp. F2636L TaxID=2996018 RepID=UPI00225E35DD|nr:T9SS type A sorting domain-containing protein [Xanthomarina sp. F2636L]MCX7551657.1 T9SS type A sorting domain-containing protein [Xanthomarina sp. F2636L]
MKKITLLIVCLLTSILVKGQWNSDTAINTLVDPTVSIDTKSMVNSQGETVIVYWKNLLHPENWDLKLYVQKLDASGNKLFGENGKLISNNIPMNSFTSQWSFTLDSNDNMYVGATGTDGNVGFAFKLDSEGNNQWTDSGISLGSGYLVRILPLSSGDVLISWLSGSFSGSIQKYSSDGNAIWANPINLGSGAVSANMYELSDGSFTSIYHQLLSGITSKLIAQRFDTDGQAVWANPTELFTAGNNTVYNVPYSGLQDNDVIYYSYKLAHDNRFDAYVQRINPDGSLPWGDTGVDFDIDQTNYEQEIQIAMTPGSQHIYALCRYTESTQTLTGVYLQKLDKDSGMRLFTENAKEVYSIGAGKSPTRDLVIINEQPIFLTLQNNHLHVNLLDSNGDFVWEDESKQIATFDTFKSFINFNKISNSEMVAVFIEDKGDGEKVYAQNFTDNALSVNDVELMDEIHFINPINNILELRSNSIIKEVTIYNSLGQLVSKIRNNNSQALTINSNNWNSGIYLVNVKTSQNKSQVIKILKK